MPGARREIAESPFKQWLTRKRANMLAKAKTIVRVRVDVRPVTMDAKARTPAKAREAARPTEVNRRKHSNESLAIYFSSSCASRVRGPEFSKSYPRIRSQKRGRSFPLSVLT